MRLEIPFNGPAYDEGFMSPQECINFYPYPYPGGVALVGPPGLEQWVDLSDEIRGSLVVGAYLYVLAGRNLYRVATDGSYTLLGSMGSISGQVSIASNGVDIVVSDGYEGYVYDLSSGGFSQITDSDFPGGVVVHIDGYYLANRPGSGEVWRSDWNDGSSWDGLAFSTAGRDPDNVVSLLVDHSDVFVQGERTTEIWYNAGAATFNFSSIPGALIEQGIVSPHANTNINNAVYWVGKDRNGAGSVFQSIGRQPKIISTSPVNLSLNGDDLTQTIMFSYSHREHSFVVIVTPSSTWVYDSTTSQWHKRSSRVSGADVAWVARTSSYFGSNIIGCSDGKLSKLAEGVYEDNGSPIIGIRTTPIMRDRQNRITVDEVQVVNEPGVGLISGDSEDINPMAMLSWSRDGGSTWSPEIDIPLGKIGETTNVSRVTQLGQGINWCFKYKVSAAVKRVLLGAVAEVTPDD